MRSLRQLSTQKPRDSKFFENLRRQYGGTIPYSSITPQDVASNLRSFYLDLSFGNIQQDKYIQILEESPVIIDVALRDLYAKSMKAYVLLESLKVTKQTNAQITKYKQFDEIMNEADNKYYTYMSLYDGVTAYSKTRDKNYLIAISAKFSNPMNRDTRRVLL